MRMLGHVRQTFLGDAEQHGFLFGVQVAHVVALEVHAQPATLHVLFQIRAQRRQEAQLVQHRGP